MRASVEAAFAGFTRKLEGEVPWMYVDVLGLVTTGLGNLIDPIEHAVGLPWLDRVSGASADEATIRAEWRVLKDDRVRLAVAGHRACEPITRLRLTSESISELVTRKAHSNEQILRTAFPGYDGAPADAQLGLMSMAWALGAGFANKWPQFSAAARASDWRGAAVECRMREAGNPGVVPRNDANERLFRNSAVVLEARLDPDELHYPSVLIDEVTIVGLPDDFTEGDSPDDFTEDDSTEGDSTEGTEQVDDDADVATTAGKQW